MISERSRRGTWVAALTIVLFGCSGTDVDAGAEAAGEGAAEMVPLRIGYSDWPGWVPWQIALEKGFFEANEVAVDLVWMDYVPSMEAFAGGQLDAVSMTNGDALVTGATADRASTAILINDYSNGNDMIIGGPGIESLEDLRGRTIGVEVGFVDHLLLLNGLEDAGMTQDDVVLMNIPTNETPQALASGGVDAIGAWQPSSGQALKTVAGSQPIYTSADEPGIIYDLLYVSRESLGARRDDWLKVVRTWYDVVEYMKDPANTEEMLGILAARVSLPPEEYAPFLDGTYILSLEEAIGVFLGDTEQGFASLAGSTQVVDDFNVRYEVYPEAEAEPAYQDPSLTLEVAAERGLTVPAAP
jgi:NitT/TauT family transport system substrate-binding protein